MNKVVYIGENSNYGNFPLVNGLIYGRDDTSWENRHPSFIVIDLITGLKFWHNRIHFISLEDWRDKKIDSIID